MTSVVDSLGVQLITIAASARGAEPWSTVAAPVIEIGSASGEPAYLLSQPQAGVRLADGVVVIADGGSEELRYFDEEARHLRTVGGSGEGPGEFRSIAHVSLLPADSLIVFDTSLQRATLFGPSGRFVDSWNLTAAGGPAYLLGAGALAGGQLVTSSWLGTEPEAEGPYRLATVIGYFDRVRQDFSPIDTVQASEEGQVERDGRLLRAFRPFGAKNDIAASPTEVFVLDASSDREIRVFDAHGELDRILRFDMPRTAVTDQMVSEWIESFIARYSDGSEALAEFWQLGFQRVPARDSVPLFRSLEVDVDGNVCAERYGFTETAPRLYWCISTEGELLRRITMSDGIDRQAHPHLEPQVTIGQDYVMGIWVDELGVERVRLYDLKADPVQADP